MSSGNKRMKISYNDSDFICTAEAGKVHIRRERTARGQQLIVGVFDPKDKTWHNDNGTFPLPTFVKEQVELFYA